MNDSYKNVSKISSFLGKIVIFLYTGKIIQVLDFNNWHPLNNIFIIYLIKMFQTTSRPNKTYKFAYFMCKKRYNVPPRKKWKHCFSGRAYISLHENGQESPLAKICHGSSNLDTAAWTVMCVLIF